MISINISVIRSNFSDAAGRFMWAAYSQNHTKLFQSLKVFEKFRNCVNNIDTITRYMKNDTVIIRLNKEADELRKRLKEPLYGIRG